MLIAKSNPLNYKSYYSAERYIKNVKKSTDFSDSERGSAESVPMRKGAPRGGKALPPTGRLPLRHEYF